MAKAVGAADFLGALFGDWCGPDRRIAIWTFPDKRARFFKASDDAAEYAMQRADDSDVYFGVGLYRAGIKRGRGKATDVVAITALWADIDYGKHPSGKKFPPNREEALKVVAHCGVSPTITVLSGHGLHAYWLLKEPLEPGDRMADVARIWQGTLAACAKTHGYDLDSVGDVSRLLRVPQTFNRKGGGATQVVVDKWSDVRHDTPDFEQWFHADAYNATRDESTPVDVLTVNHDANPDSLLLTASLDNSKLFERTWNKQRKGELIDGSPSGYDLSLAAQAVAMGWADQQIANLILAFRKKHGHDDAKGRRRDYLTATIAKAKRNRETDMAVNAIDTICDRGDSDSNDEILKNLRRALRLPIARWLQHGIYKALYSLVLDDGREIIIGDAGDVMYQPAFHRRIYEVVADLPPTIKPAQWNRLLRGLGVIREVIDNPERSVEGRGEDIIGSYVQMRAPATGKDWVEALRNRMPFIKHVTPDADAIRRTGERAGEYLHVHLTSLKTFCKFDRDEQWSTDDLTNTLRVIGFKETEVTSRAPRARARYWRRITEISDDDRPTK